MHLQSSTLSGIACACLLATSGAGIAAEPAATDSVTITQEIVSPLQVTGTPSGFEAKGLVLQENEYLGMVTIDLTGGTASAVGVKWTGGSAIPQGTDPAVGFLVDGADATKTLRVAFSYPDGSNAVVDGAWWKRVGAATRVPVQVIVDGGQTATAGSYTGTLNVGAWD